MAIALRSEPVPRDDLVAVLFDFDGTLLDSRPADEAAVEALLELDPAAAAGAELFWSLEGDPIERRIELAWPGRLAEILPLFANVVPTDLFPGVEELVRTLHQQQMVLGVVSSRRRLPLVEGLRGTGIRSLFREVVGLEDVSRPKPDPEGLLLICHRLQVSPAQAVYIGDRAVDMEAAQAAGMLSWRAVWGQDGAGAPRGGVLLRRPADVLRRLDGLRREVRGL